MEFVCQKQIWGKIISALLNDRIYFKSMYIIAMVFHKIPYFPPKNVGIMAFIRIMAFYKWTEIVPCSLQWAVLFSKYMYIVVCVPWKQWASYMQDVIICKIHTLNITFVIFLPIFKTCKMIERKWNQKLQANVMIFTRKCNTPLLNNADLLDYMSILQK